MKKLFKSADKRKVDNLKLSSHFGGIYFVMSIAVINFCILLTILTAVLKKPWMVYLIAAVGLLYCGAILGFEIIRSKRNKKIKAQAK